MSVLVAIVGLFILGIGVAVLLSPAQLKRVLRIFLQKRWWRLAAAIRILIGIVLLIAASETRAPAFVFVVGVLFIAAGASLPLIGSARLERLSNWWLERPDVLFRLWALATVAFGAALVWCGME